MKPKMPMVIYPLQIDIEGEGKDVDGDPPLQIDGEVRDTDGDPHVQTNGKGEVKDVDDNPSTPNWW